MSKKIEIVLPDTSDLLIWKRDRLKDIELLINALEKKYFKKVGITGWKIAYFITKKCGPHYPVFGHTKTWLWVETRREKLVGGGDVTTHECVICGEKNDTTHSNKNYDFIPDYMKEDRLKNAPAMIQRWNKDNELSREFVETYPDQVKGMIDKGVVTKQQVRKSKYTYKKDMKGLNNLKYEGIASHLGKE